MTLRRPALWFAFLVTLMPLAVRAGTPPCEAQIRHDEMQIEIAWLADPRTFPCPLVAFFEGTTLKIYGNVPSHEVANLALKLAEDHCSVPVINGLQIRSSHPVKAPTESLDRIQREAIKILTEAFPSLVHNLTVKTEAPGKIHVTGSLLSMEDKRTVSKRLKQIRGCHAVVNEVQVTPVLQFGQTVMRVSADSSLVLGVDPRSVSGPLPSPTLQKPPTHANRFAPFGTQTHSPMTHSEGVVRAAYIPTPSDPSAAAPTNGQTSPDKQFSAIKLKRQIERACGMAAREVHVQGNPGSGLSIRIKSRTQEESQRLFDKVIQLPELQPYRVQLQVQAERP